MFLHVNYTVSIQSYSLLHFCKICFPFCHMFRQAYNKHILCKIFAYVTIPFMNKFFRSVNHLKWYAYVTARHEYFLLSYICLINNFLINIAHCFFCILIICILLLLSQRKFFKGKNQIDIFLSNESNPYLCCFLRPWKQLFPI